MYHQKYNKSAKEAVIYTNIEKNACFELNDDTIINGIIEDGAIISISGEANVRINADVCETVKFRISGSGTVLFTVRPPKTVLNNIEKSGTGSLFVHGGFLPDINNQETKKIKNYGAGSSSQSMFSAINNNNNNISEIGNSYKKST